MMTRPILTEDIATPEQPPGSFLVEPQNPREVERRIIAAAASLGLYCAPVFFSVAPDAADVGTNQTTLTLVQDAAQGPLFVTDMQLGTSLAYARLDVRNASRRITEGVVRALDALDVVRTDRGGMSAPLVILGGDALSVGVLSSSIVPIAATHRLKVRGLVLRDANGTRVVDSRGDEVAALVMREGEWFATGTEAGGGTSLTTARQTTGAAGIVDHVITTVESLGSEGAVIAATMTSSIGAHVVANGVTPVDNARTVYAHHDVRVPVPAGTIIEVAATWPGAIREPVRLCLVGRRVGAAGVEV